MATCHHSPSMANPTVCRAHTGGRSPVPKRACGDLRGGSGAIHIPTVTGSRGCVTARGHPANAPICVAGGVTVPRPRPCSKVTGEPR